jgi:2-amino-4-hydroxy-6-hydroxymethyldihydropteridine diphosphokinase
MQRPPTSPSPEPAPAVASQAALRTSASSRSPLLRPELYLGLGSNVGPDRHIPAALRLLGTLGCLEAVSGLYRTSPVGLTGQPDFHNLALRLRTDLSPLFLLERCQRVERQLGRVPRRRWGPREIDVDLLLCRPAVVVDHPRLKLPHPRLLERAFVLAPLLELASGWSCLELFELRKALLRASGQGFERLGEVADVYGGCGPEALAASAEPFQAER